MHKAHRSRSVRVHLAGIVVVVIAVFAGVGGLLGHQTWQNAKQNIDAEAAFLAGFAARGVNDSAAAALAQVQAIAANPGVAPLLTDATTCTLDFSLLLFPGSHLDLVRTDGTVACSSADLPAHGSSHAGASWASAPLDTVGVSEIFADDVTGEPAIAFVAAIEVEGHVVGSVAVVVPTAPVAQVIADTYGGARHYDFALVDTTFGRVLSSSHDRVDTSSAPSATVADPLPGHIISVTRRWCNDMVCGRRFRFGQCAGADSLRPASRPRTGRVCAAGADRVDVDRESPHCPSSARSDPRGRRRRNATRERAGRRSTDRRRSSTSLDSSGR